MISRKHLKLVGAGVAAAAVVGGLARYDVARKETAAAAASAASEPTPVPVVVAPARLETVPARIEAVGTVVADRQVLVAAEVAGRVTAIHFDSNDVVEAGQPLVQINDGPLRRELDRRQASARLAAASLDRAQRLQNLAISRQEFDQRSAAADEARALVAQTQEDIAQRQVRAPFAGTLGVRRVNLGQYVHAGDPLATLTDTSRLHVDFTVPERHRGVLAVGQRVEVASDGAPDGRFPGRVTAIDPLVDEGSRAVRVRATLEDGTRGRLWPGKFARVALALPPGPPSVTVPAAAVERSLSGETVFVVRSGDGAHRRAVAVPVRTGVRINDRVALVNGGVVDGDPVVIAGRANLRDGAAVQPRETANPTAGAQAPGTVE